MIMKKFLLVVMLVLFTAFKVSAEGPLIVDGQNGDLFIPATAMVKWTSKPIVGLECYNRSTPKSYICVDKGVIVRDGDMKVVLPAKRATKA